MAMMERQFGYLIHPTQPDFGQPGRMVYSDNVGRTCRFRDIETGECVVEFTISEFTVSKITVVKADAEGNRRAHHFPGRIRYYDPEVPGEEGLVAEFLPAIVVGLREYGTEVPTPRSKPVQTSAPEQ